MTKNESIIGFNRLNFVSTMLPHSVCTPQASVWVSRSEQVCLLLIVNTFVSLLGLPIWLYVHFHHIVAFCILDFSHFKFPAYQFISVHVSRMSCSACADDSGFWFHFKSEQLTFSYSLSDTERYSDVLWHTETYCDVLWRTETYCDVLWRTETYWDMFTAFQSRKFPFLSV